MNTSTGYCEISTKEDENEGFFTDISDVKLISNDGYTFNAHRFLLAKHSPFFRDLFIHCKSDKKPTVIPNVRGVVLEQLMYFMNTECVLINRENITELMIGADYLQIDDMSRQLKIFSESILSVENSLQIYVASLKISDANLCESSYRIIQTNFHTILDDHESNLMAVPVEILKKILSDKNLRVVGENVVWVFITKWARIDPSNRFKEVFDFLRCLKIYDVEESMAKEIIGSDIISKNPYCEKLKDIAFQKLHNNIDVLRCIIDTWSESSEMSTCDFYSHRLPSCLHLIACFIILDDGTEHTDIYVTYDENIDIWRKATEVVEKFSTPLVIGSEIYIFDFDLNGQIFNLYEKQWREIGKLRSSDDFYCNLSLASKNNIYFISSDICEETTLKFECYNTKNGLFSEKTPLNPVSEFQAALFQDKIFVIGHALGVPDLSMLAQVYEEDLDSWFVITPPNIYRHYFDLIPFHDKLYVIGGRDTEFHEIDAVEVFDPQKNEWYRIEDLPSVIKDPVNDISSKQFLALNDKLLVIYQNVDFGCKEVHYVLNETTKTWEPPEKPVHQHDDFGVDLVHTIYDRKLIKSLVKESRHLTTSLKKSVFY